MNLNINKNINLPVYQQIVSSVISDIEEGNFLKDDQLPSINQIASQNKIAKETVVKALKILQERGIIQSVHGKGFFIASTDVNKQHRIFVLFNEYSSYKKDLYNAMLDKLGNEGELDLFFHHNNKDVFKQLVDSAAGKYTSYIIMPTEDRIINEYIVKALPEKSVFILDFVVPYLKDKYPFVAQDFENDIYEAFKRDKRLISKYDCIRLINTDKRPHILNIEKGLGKFCKLSQIHFSVEALPNNLQLKGKDLFVCIEDGDLVALVEWGKENNLKPGTDFGIISYNETALKRVVGDGIATLSTNFKKMGESIIDLVMNKKKDRIYNESSLIVRNSI